MKTDVHDYLAASRNTDSALEMLRAYCSRLEENALDGDDEKDICLTLGLAAVAVVAAIREASTRADYVARVVSQ